MSPIVHRSLITAGALAILIAAPAFAGPPWISIEVPPNPFDQASRNAFVLVRTYHHGDPAVLRVTATAEGLVRGERRSVELAVDRTTRHGVYAIRKQWPSEGVWTLVIASRDGDNTATALVDVDAAGQVSAVRVPTRRMGNYDVPRAVALQEIESALRERQRANDE